MQARIVNRIAHASPSEEILLKGRQLFIHEEMASLETTGEQLKPPLEFCIVLCDQYYNPLDGELWLQHRPEVVWRDAERMELDMGNWLFSNVPQDSHEYRAHGESLGFLDPISDETQHMSINDLKVYHYHILYPSGPHRHIDMAGYPGLGYFAIDIPIDCDEVIALNELHQDVYEGITNIGFREYKPDFEYGDWIRYGTHEIKLTDPYPLHLNFHFTGLDFKEGYRVWWFWECIPKSSEFITLWTDLYFIPKE
jgi:hypothetical protein